eukprot:CAMPEP_0169086454 /NCGR_PEP_ID=MMETSP1015-20121227/13707_1 /TAXON_ID=342587 /ORGANISM="Karlodinium micrum, Strain CCMP2283" /LENGTH=158 /DNA_ID=CAMNT_0009146619 /DNA_START=141 /DNA_END=617 /DNA_ORIENTATION=-
MPAVVAASLLPPQQPSIDPEAVEKQKAAYAKALEQQLVDGNAQIIEEAQRKKDALIAAARQQKAQYKLQKESELQTQHLQLDQQLQSQKMMLQEAVNAQHAALEQQAAALTLEYTQKKAEEEMLMKRYQIMKQYYDAEMQLAKQYQAVAGHAPPPIPV